MQIFFTEGVDTINVSILQKFGKVGNHRCFILDFTAKSILGNVFPRIVPHVTRKLHCNSQRPVRNYNETLNGLPDEHKMFDKLNTLHSLIDTIEPVALSTPHKSMGYSTD